MIGCPIGSRSRVNRPRVFTRTPLMIAAINNCSEVVQYILGTGLVNVDKSYPSDGATAIDCAYGANSSPRIIRMLHRHSTARKNRQ